MKVKDLIKQLEQLNQDDDIIITSMDDHFVCSNFEVRSNHEGESAQEIIMDLFINDWE